LFFYYKYFSSLNDESWSYFIKFASKLLSMLHLPVNVVLIDEKAFYTAEDLNRIFILNISQEELS